MNTLFKRLSYWWEERTAELEDKTVDTVIPPADETFDRLTAFGAALQQHLRLPDWMRGRNRQP